MNEIWKGSGWVLDEIWMKTEWDLRRICMNMWMISEWNLNGIWMRSKRDRNEIWNEIWMRNAWDLNEVSMKSQSDLNEVRIRTESDPKEIAKRSEWALHGCSMNFELDLDGSWMVWNGSEQTVHEFWVGSARGWMHSNWFVNSVEWILCVVFWLGQQWILHGFRSDLNGFWKSSEQALMASEQIMFKSGMHCQWFLCEVFYISNQAVGVLCWDNSFLVPWQR